MGKTSQVIEDLKSKKEENTVQNRSAAVKVLWTALSEEEKAVYTKKAAEKKAVYDAEMVAFKESDAWKEYQGALDKSKKKAAEAGDEEESSKKQKTAASEEKVFDSEDEE